MLLWINSELLAWQLNDSKLKIVSNEWLDFKAQLVSYTCHDQQAVKLLYLNQLACKNLSYFSDQAELINDCIFLAYTTYVHF